MKTAIVALALTCLASSAPAHGLPFTQSDTFEFIQRDESGYHFHKPSFLNTIIPVGGKEVVASYYGKGEKLGRYTANGDVFDSRRYTAANWSLPFGTKLLVEYKGRRVVVVVTDRGPAKRLHRFIDLSYGAAKKIGLLKAGVGLVKVALL